MKQCPHCQQYFDDTQSFCSACGVALQVVQQEGEPTKVAEKQGFFAKFFGTKGRIGRQTYILRGLAMGITLNLVLPGIFTLIVGGGGDILSAVVVMAGFTPVLMILSFWSALALSAQRFHDLGFPGTYALRLFIPIYNFYIIYQAIFVGGQPHANEYGNITQ